MLQKCRSWTLLFATCSSHHSWIDHRSLKLYIMGVGGGGGGEVESANITYAQPFPSFGKLKFLLRES